MVRRALILLGLTLILALPNASAAYPTEPVGDWYLIDQGSVLSESQEIEMEQKLMDLQNATGTLVRVVTIRSMFQLDVNQNEEYFDADQGYARGMYQYYGMEGGENKTILIAMSVYDRRFKFVMPDHSGYAQAESQNVFDNDVAPYLGADQWNSGLTNAIIGIEPYAADEFKILPKSIFWALLIVPLLLIPIVVKRTRTNFNALNYDSDATYISLNRLLKESIIQRGITTFDAMDGDDDSKAKWELLDDINTIKEHDIDYTPKKSQLSMIEKNEKYLLESELVLFSSVRINKRAEDAHISDECYLELNEFEEDIDRINLHLSVMDHLRFGAYMFTSIIFITPFLLLNGFLKSSGLALDEILLSGTSWNGLFMIFIPLVLAGVYAFAVTFIKPIRHSMSSFAAMLLLPSFGSNVYYIPSKLEQIDKTTNASNTVEMSSFLLGATLFALEDLTLVSAGRDEFGNEMYDVHRPVYSSDGGGGGGGSSCGGGGCGGGGCGGGGGF